MIMGVISELTEECVGEDKTDQVTNDTGMKQESNENGKQTNIAK
jgi:hypothetical protein